LEKGSGNGVKDSFIRGLEGSVNRAELEALADSLAASPPHEILARAVDRFPRITFATGFGVEGCLLIDLIARNDLRIDLFTLDTGLLFPETYALWRRLEARYGVTIRAVRPERTVAEQAVEFGDQLWEREAERCCGMRKVLPFSAALAPFQAWVSAIRRDQTRERAGAQIVEWDPTFGLVKVNPLALWTASDVWSSIRRNEVPFNPLHEQGYPSIGCVPCTGPVLSGEDPRAGRWRGREKKECGIHARFESRAVSWNPNREETSGDVRTG
jgi:phosphoadenosine phosphosulfate reductase